MHKSRQGKFFSLIASIAALLLAGCAVSPNYGEKGLLSFQEEYGIKNPVDPQYKIKNVQEDFYNITVHQGSIFISSRYERQNHLIRAAETVAESTCAIKGKYAADKTYDRIGTSGWVHVQGSFRCADSKNRTAKKEPQQEAVVGSGTGFMVSDDGHIATAYHVIAGAEKILIRTEGGEVAVARLIAQDKQNDLAVLKANLKSPTPLPLAKASSVRKGEQVMSLGYPRPNIQGAEQKASFGRINAKSGIRDDFRNFQIDVDTQPGNSGGPLINRHSEVVGVVISTINQSKIYKASGSLAQRVNYAVKADYLIPLIESAGVSIPSQSGHGRSDELGPETVEATENSVVIIVTKR